MSLYPGWPYDHIVTLFAAHLSALKNALRPLVPGHILAGWEGARGAADLYDYVDSHFRNALLVETFKQALVDDKIGYILVPPPGAQSTSSASVNVYVGQPPQSAYAAAPPTPARFPSVPAYDPLVTEKFQASLSGGTHLCMEALHSTPLDDGVEFTVRVRVRKTANKAAEYCESQRTLAEEGKGSEAAARGVSYLAFKLAYETTPEGPKVVRRGKNID